MGLWKHLSGLDPTALWALVLLCLRHPLWVFPTIKATRECVAMCNLIYGKEHHRNTAANAFRHALWNFYIARACYKRNGSTEKVLQWTKKFTDWHEDFSKNPPIARQMDLHNNRIGRMLFKENPQVSTEEAIGIFKAKAKASLKVTELQEIEAIDSNRFVHLKE